MKTVTDIRQSSARDTFIAVSVYVVLNSLLDWKPVVKLKQRFTCVFFQYEASSTVLYATKVLAFAFFSYIYITLTACLAEPTDHKRLCFSGSVSVRFS